MTDYPLALSYDDVAIVPTYSGIVSRDDVALSVTLPKGYKVSSPIVCANMVFQNSTLLRKCLDHGSLVLLHRFHDYNDTVDVYEELNRYNESNIEHPTGLLGVSVGVQAQDYSNVDTWVKEVGVKCICVDVAHADSKLSHDMVNYIASNYPYVLLIAGNVCTYDGASGLFGVGADIVKVGIAGGSVCTTKNATGVHVPQFTAVYDCYGAANDYMFNFSSKHVAIIADGGIKKPGDAAKALTRADLVMMGNEFASTYEAVGSLTDPVKYAGSSTLKSRYIEGKEELVYAKRTVDELYEEYHDGIRSACSYMNAKSIEDIQGWGNFVRVTR